MNFKLLNEKIKNKRRKQISFKRMLKSFSYASEGIKYTLINEQNLIVHSICALLAIILGFVFKISAIEWIIIVIVIGLVVCAELINTSIEAIVDLVCPELHPLAKIAKDTASGAVLSFAIVSIIVGLIIFLPKIF